MSVDDICRYVEIGGCIVYCNGYTQCKYKSKYQIPHGNGREVSGRMFECYKYKVIDIIEFITERKRNNRYDR